MAADLDIATLDIRVNTAQVAAAGESLNRLSQAAAKAENTISKYRRAKKRLRTIAGILVRELFRKLPQSSTHNYIEELNIFLKSSSPT